MSLVKACDYFYTSVIFLLYQLIEVLFAFIYHINLLLKYLRISALLSIALLVRHIYTQISIVILKFLRFSAFISVVGLLSFFLGPKLSRRTNTCTGPLPHYVTHRLTSTYWNFSASFHFFRKMSLVPLAFRRPLR